MLITYFSNFCRNFSSEQYFYFTLNIKALFRILILALSDVCRRHPTSKGQFMSWSAGYLHEAAIPDFGKHGCCRQMCGKWWIWQFNCMCRLYHGYVKHNQTVQNMATAHVWIVLRNYAMDIIYNQRWLGFHVQAEAQDQADYTLSFYLRT